MQKTAASCGHYHAWENSCAWKNYCLLAFSLKTLHHNHVTTNLIKHIVHWANIIILTWSIVIHSYPKSYSNCMIPQGCATYLQFHLYVYMFSQHCLTYLLGFRRCLKQLIMADVDHYAVLGIQPEGSGLAPIPRVLALSRVSKEEVKDAYQRAVDGASGNPFKLTLVNRAFQVLSSSDERRLHDLRLMEQAASVAWL